MGQPDEVSERAVLNAFAVFFLFFSSLALFVFRLCSLASIGS